MAYTPQDWSISALAVELDMDRRTVAKRVRDLVPCREDSKSKFYRMADVVRGIIGSASSGDLDLNAERARLAKEQADKAEIDNRLRRGELIDAADLFPALDACGTAIKQKLLGIPVKCAPVVAAMETLPEIRAELESSIHDALRELSTLDGLGCTEASVVPVEAPADPDAQSVGGQVSETVARV